MTAAPDVNRYKPSDVSDLLNGFGIPAHKLELITIVTGWQKRSPQMVTAAALLSSLCAQYHVGTASFNVIATALDATAGRQLSRQSVANRFVQPCQRFRHDW
jgi:hypothetical protein